MTQPLDTHDPQFRQRAIALLDLAFWTRQNRRDQLDELRRMAALGTTEEQTWEVRSQVTQPTRGREKGTSQ